MSYDRAMATPSVDLQNLSSALSAAVSRLNRRLRTEAGTEWITPSQAAVIRHLLAAGPATTSELARAHEVRPQSMSATVASLEAMGYIDRSAAPDDGRAMVVAMTDAGRTAIETGRAAKRDWLAHALDERLTDGELRQLDAAVVLLERLLVPS